jgi:hypothetical protein
MHSAKTVSYEVIIYGPPSTAKPALHRSNRYIRIRSLESLDTPRLASAVLSVICGSFHVLVHINAHVKEVGHAPDLRHPLRRLAVA